MGCRTSGKLGHALLQTHDPLPHRPDWTPAALMLFKNDWLPVVRRTWTRLANVELDMPHCHEKGSPTSTTRLGERTLTKAANAASTTKTPAPARTRPKVPPNQQNCRPSNCGEERERGRARWRCACRTCCMTSKERERERERARERERQRERERERAREREREGGRGGGRDGGEQEIKHLPQTQTEHMRTHSLERVGRERGRARREQT